MTGIDTILRGGHGPLRLWAEWGGGIPELYTTYYKEYCQCETCGAKFDNCSEGFLYMWIDDHWDPNNMLSCRDVVVRDIIA